MFYDNLATFASKDENFLGRKYAYNKSEFRGEYQRDRDRVIHSNSFRRLKFKTQVFVYHEGDHFRTRLTHSLEVSQIARSIARVLKLNEDLCEVLSLAHDLGHTPFGHAGEIALSNCMLSETFDHNIQSLRILIALEDMYDGHKGLNLSINTLDGLLKHNGPVTDATKYKNQLPEIFEYDFSFKNNGSLEAQISSLSDDIAYNCHDIDDGLRAELFSIHEILDLNFSKKYLNNKKNLNKKNLVRNLLSLLVNDLITNSRENIKKANIQNINDVYTQNELVSFSENIIKGLDEIREFLRSKMYNHSNVNNWNLKSEEIIETLFKYFLIHNDKLPQINKKYSLERNIADYISGMTDKFALNIYNKIKQ